MRANIYKILSRCIEDGVNAGFAKAHKHTDTPSESHVKEMIENYIWIEICEYFEFDEPE